MGSSTRTVSGLQFNTLVEPRDARKHARKLAMFKSNGDIDKFQDSMWSFRHDYRRKYSYRFLKALGFNSEAVAAERALNKTDALNYLIAKGVTPTANDVYYGVNRIPMI